MSSAVAIVINLLFILQCCTAQSLYTPPRIHEPSKAITHYVLAEQNLFLDCRAEGSGRLTYKWKLNGNVIRSGGATTVDPDNGHLNVTRFTTREEGQYQCFVENEVRSTIIPVAVSPVVTVLQTRLGEDWTVNTVEEIAKNNRDYAALKCRDAPESVPKARFSWFVQSADGKKLQIPEDERRYVDNKGTLHFIYLKKDDEQPSDSTQYKCALYNGLMDNIQLGSPTTIKVASNTWNDMKPKNEYTTNSATFLLSETAELECVFSGYPIPRVRWLDKEKKEIFTNTKYEIDPLSNDRKLKIKNLEESDEGFYYCQGSNSAGTSELSSVYLDITSDPIWTKGLTYQTLPEGKDAVFTCQARPAYNDVRLSDPVWYKNGVKLPKVSPDGKIHFSENLGVLTVENVEKPWDIMCFQCNVSNEVGFVFDNACLNVIKPIVIGVFPPEVQEIQKGDAVDLTVRGTTDPGLTLMYRWRFRNQTYELGPPPHVTYDDVTKVAYINTSELTDEEFWNTEGVYYRDLYHQFETRTIATEVILKHRVTPAPVFEASFPWWVVILVIVLLIIIIIVALIIFCCCRNKDKGDYRIYKTELNTAYLHPDQDIENNKFKAVARVGNEDDPEASKPLKLGPHYDISEDEADSLDQYQGGKLSAVNFTEDGSFIGQYASKDSQDL